jgi:hypothetical protein
LVALAARPALTTLAAHPCGLPRFPDAPSRAFATPRQAASEDGWTPLHLAARAGSAAKARLLLDAGANPAAATKQGHTPLSLVRAAAGCVRARPAASRPALTAGRACGGAGRKQQDAGLGSPFAARALGEGVLPTSRPPSPSAAAAQAVTNGREEVRLLLEGAGKGPAPAPRAPAGGRASQLEPAFA